MFSALLPLADSPALKDVVLIEASEEQAEAQRLSDENADDEAMINQLSNDYADGAIDRSVFMKQQRRLTNRIEQRLDRLSVLRGQSALNRLGGNIRKTWKKMNADDRRLVILSLCDHTSKSHGPNEGDALNLTG